MKIGIRTPSIKKSIKARTTGKIKRTIKNTYNPVYNKKGMGVINNPKKAVYNKVYKKTTTDSLQNIKNKNKKKTSSTSGILWFLGIIFIIIGVLTSGILVGIIFFVLGIGLISVGNSI